MTMIRRNRSRLPWNTVMISMIIVVAVKISETTMVSAFTKTPYGSHSRSVGDALQSSADDFGALTSQLARLDQQFQIQQKKKPQSRWSKLVLPPVERGGEEDGGSGDDDYVWILEPPLGTTIPSCMIVFTGGAGLGQFPHIAYNELLTRISDRLNAVCISAPYQVAGLDHFTMAKTTGEQLRRALVFCQDDPARQYPENLPTYALSHSLGGKLQTIYLGATGQNYNGIGLISFNNFSFGRTISMVKEFASQLQETTSPGGFSNMGDNSAILNTVFSFAENLVTGMGVDFTPSPADTERLIQLRYNKDLQAKTRMFVMDEDNLDSSEQFVNLCSCSEGDEQVTVSGLPGGHLAPVFIRLGLDDLDLDDMGDGIPFDAKTMAQEAMGGLQSAAFGNESDLNGLVEEICSWIFGKAPKRGANWDDPSSRTAGQVPPRLAQGPPSDD